jgi:hypothetical protein
VPAAGVRPGPDQADAERWLGHVVLRGVRDLGLCLAVD